MRISHTLRDNRGFTLLEFVFAFALITIVLTTVYISQSTTLFSSSRTRDTTIATNLARNFLAVSEANLENKSFEEIEEEEEGKFAEPYGRFRWKREVKEINFDALAELLANNIMEKNELQGIAGEESMLLDMFKEFLKKSVRKLQVTIEWQEGKGKANLTFSTFLVNYDADFAPKL